MKELKYSEVRSEMRTGDIIAFAGNNVFANAIKLFTGKCKNDHYVSHVAMVSQAIVGNHDLIQVIESCKKENVVGVQFNRMSDHMKYYDGDIWWYPIKRDYPVATNIMLRWLLAQEGKPYDLGQAILSALDFVPQLEDSAALFCSELCAEALEVGKVIAEVNSSKTLPVELIDDYDIYEEPVKLLLDFTPVKFVQSFTSLTMKTK